MVGPGIKNLEAAFDTERTPGLLPRLKELSFVQVLGERLYERCGWGREIVLRSITHLMGVDVGPFCGLLNRCFLNDVELTLRNTNFVRPIAVRI